MRLKIEQIAAFSQATVAVAARDDQRYLTGFTWDSRTLVPGDLFVALPGERVEGNDFIAEAVRRGAAAVLASRAPSDAEGALARERGAAILLVEDGVLAFARLAAAWRNTISPELIAVTGSSGKTSTREMIAAICSQSFETLASSANHNNEIGLPASLLAAMPTTEVLVLEMAMRGLGQIAELCRIARPRLGVITNVGTAHLEMLGSREAIARAKAELVSGLPDGRGVAFLNGDDAFSPFIREVAHTAARDIRVVSFGLSAHNDVRASHISYNACGEASFDLWLPGFPEPWPVTLTMPGEHSVKNALAAAAVGAELSIAPAAIVLALEALKPLPLRQNRVRLTDGTVILDDSYNANPDSMRAALALLLQQPKDLVRVAVFGDMLELGSREDEFHRKLGASAATGGVDMLITVGKRARSYALGAREAGMNADAIFVCSTIDEALVVLRERLTRASVILVKGSRALGLERITEEMKTR
ncbi:MAG: UDP-N-acetylmuramoyl-tripeptide--D-alanyl-D-alanine ligase [Coriobacteriales bacterium]|jgi:UDP-N-acetylmuramoyl-tripeptide--D-alanyl-D-alanine ligase|nr:UDP-N-acetylmuramoyl-tripeptide--D-alanyl-D-alanine ligase [Coriobacteriales bacterium]